MLVGQPIAQFIELVAEGVGILPGPAIAVVEDRPRRDAIISTLCRAASTLHQRWHVHERRWPPRSRFEGSLLRAGQSAAFFSPRSLFLARVLGHRTLPVPWGA
jgi:hypothetical protein